MTNLDKIIEYLHYHQGANRDGRVWNDNVAYEERKRRETAGVGNPNVRSKQK